MSITVPGSLTGSAQTGFTSPSYTTSVDTPPDVNAKQVAVTAKGGTQTGVDVHTNAKPFTITVFKPKVVQTLPRPNINTGSYPSIPKNTVKIVTRKGVSVDSNGVLATMVIRTEIEVPAGSDTADAPNIRAALSAHIGAMSDQSSGIGDTSINGVL